MCEKPIFNCKNFASIMKVACAVFIVGVLYIGASFYWSPHLETPKVTLVLRYPTELDQLHAQQAKFQETLKKWDDEQPPQPKIEGKYKIKAVKAQYLIINDGKRCLVDDLEYEMYQIGDEFNSSRKFCYDSKEGVIKAIKGKG